MVAKLDQNEGGPTAAGYGTNGHTVNNTSV